MVSSYARPARLSHVTKEEKIFREFSRHGHAVFDNDITAVNRPDLTNDQVKALHTTGRDINGQFNNTMSTEDFIDTVITLMANGMVPTDVLMHPLAGRYSAKNEYVSALAMPALGACRRQQRQDQPQCCWWTHTFCYDHPVQPIHSFRQG